MITAVVGSRTISNYSLIQEVLDSHIITSVVSGGADGVDTIAENYSYRRLKKSPIVFYPEYSKYGRSATHIRNTEIVDSSQKVIGFWDGKSRGTVDTIKYSSRKKKSLHVYLCLSFFLFFPVSSYTFFTSCWWSVYPFNITEKFRKEY